MKSCNEHVCGVTMDLNYVFFPLFPSVGPKLECFRTGIFTRIYVKTVTALGNTSTLSRQNSVSDPRRLTSSLICTAVLLLSQLHTSCFPRPTTKTIRLSNVCNVRQKRRRVGLSILLLLLLLIMFRNPTDQSARGRGAIISLFILYACIVDVP